MELRTDAAGDVTILRFLDDHLDAAMFDDFKAAVEPVLAKDLKVVFDMTSLDFVDSSGVVALMSCLRRLNERGGDLKLCGLSKPVRRLFELMRLDKVFETFPNAEKAAASFSRK